MKSFKKMTLVEKIAYEFVGFLKEGLSPKEMREVRRLNALPQYSQSCASHNFNDSNMPMMWAFEGVCGCELDLDNVDHINLFNEAFSYAKINYLTAKAR